VAKMTQTGSAVTAPWWYSMAA